MNIGFVNNNTVPANSTVQFVHHQQQQQQQHQQQANQFFQQPQQQQQIQMIHLESDSFINVNSNTNNTSNQQPPQSPMPPASPLHLNHHQSVHQLNIYQQQQQQQQFLQSTSVTSPMPQSPLHHHNQASPYSKQQLPPSPSHHVTTNMNPNQFQTTHVNFQHQNMIQQQKNIIYANCKMNYYFKLKNLENNIYLITNFKRF